MPIFEFGKDSIQPIQQTTFEAAGIKERNDLQRLLRSNIRVLAPDLLVISEEFGEWEDSRRRIDLLALDRDSNLVVIELKRDEDGGHMDLQSVRYAAMVSTLTFDQAVGIYGRYLKNNGSEADPRDSILEFLGVEGIPEEFAQEVRIILVSSEFSKEITSSVLWLRNYGVDMKCVRLKPYYFEGRLIVDVQQIIPTPEAADFQIKIQEKNRQERQAARLNERDYTRYDVRVGAESASSLSKRNAIFFVCKHLCDRGVDPDEIAQLFDWRGSRNWYVVDADVGDAAAFAEAALAKSAAGGPAFDPRRWFCEDGELIKSQSRTYAFSNQWSGDSMLRALKLLKEKYGAFGIDFSEAQGL